MPRLEQITPMVPVVDVGRSVAFFREVLGFTAVLESAEYAYVKREGVAIRLLRAGPGMDESEPAGEVACYIDVADVDGLYASLQSELDALPTGRVRAPFDQAYGQREFHVKDENGLLIFFGEAIPSGD